MKHLESAFTTPTPNSGSATGWTAVNGELRRIPCPEERVSSPPVEHAPPATPPHVEEEASLHLADPELKDSVNSEPWDFLSSLSQE